MPLMPVIRYWPAVAVAVVVKTPEPESDGPEKLKSNVVA
jgi:hypothetical protein